MRVLFVNDHLGFSGGEIHGITRWIAHVVPELRRHGVDITVCILGGWHPGADELENAGVSPIILGRAKWDPRALLDLRRLSRERDVDLLHLMGMKAIALGRLAAAGSARRVVIHFHDMIAPGSVMGAVQRRLVPWTDRALANSPATRRFAIDHYGLPPESIETLPNAIDTEQFAHPAPGARRRVRDELGIPPGAPVVGAIGRLVPEKGQHVLLRAFPEILGACPEARLLLVGEGAARDDYAKLASELGIDARVVFSGYREDVPDVLASIDVVAVPSVWDEAFGLVALEAIAQGKCVVASRSGGLELTVVDGVTGFLVPRSDPPALAQAISRVLLDDDLRRRLEAGAAEHAENFGLVPHVEKLMAIYERLLGDA